MAIKDLFKKKTPEDEFLDIRKSFGGAVPGPAAFEDMGAPAAPMGLPAVPAGPDTSMLQKELEIVSSKIDALRVEISQLTQRIASLEASLKAQQSYPSPASPASQQLFGMTTPPSQQTGWQY